MIRFGAVLAFALTLGCTSTESIRTELDAGGARRAERWTVERADPDAASPHLAGDLTIVDAVRCALLHDKGLAAALETRRAARADSTASWSGFLPRVTAEGVWQRNQQAQSFDIGGGLTVDILPEDQWSASLRVEQPLFTGGASTARPRHLTARTSCTR